MVPIFHSVGLFCLVAYILLRALNDDFDPTILLPPRILMMGRW